MIEHVSKIILVIGILVSLNAQECPPNDTIAVQPPQSSWTIEYWNDWNGVELVTWNVEKFPQKDDSTVKATAEVLLDMMADIYAIQEISDTSAFRNELMPLLVNYDYIITNKSFYFDQAIVYRRDVLTVENTTELWADTDYREDEDDDYYNNAMYYFAGRPPLRVDFKWVCGNDALEFTMINIHLKCCDEGLARRRIAAELLETFILDEMSSGNSKFIVLGDWNDDLVDEPPNDAFTNFLEDSDNFNFVTLSIAQNPSNYYDSYPSWPSFLDHILISWGLFGRREKGIATTFRLDDVISNYGEILSDHRPVGWKFSVDRGTQFVSDSLTKIVINEIMQNPNAVGDTDGEWFELYNADTVSIDLRGWTIMDGNSDSHVLTSTGPLMIDPGGYFVLGRNGDSTVNGGVEISYEYSSSFTLSNDDDEIIVLNSDSVEIDRVEYDGGPKFPDPNGASMALRNTLLDNSIGSNWVESTVPYSDGDLGTPGSYNFPYTGPVWHVSTGGDDVPGHGSYGKPLASIQHAIDFAGNSDTIAVYPGTYFENINFYGKNIVLTNWGYLYPLLGLVDITVTIDGGGDGSVITFESGEDSTTVLLGVTITNGRANKGGGIYCVDSNPTFIDCDIRENVAEWYGGGVYLENANSMFTKCLIRNNSISAGVTPAFLGAGVYSYKSKPTFFRTVVAGNEGSLVGGIAFDNSSPEIINCTISENEGYHSGAIYCLNASSPKLVNTILWEDIPTEIYFASYGDSNTVMVAYSDISGGRDSIVTNGNGVVNWEKGNIDSVPLFADSTDFNLQEGSPCIDTGTAFFTFDKDTIINLNSAEYIDSAPDMGALEFGAISIIKDSSLKPERFILYQNYPNPFNPFTTIAFELPQAGNVTLEIYDIMGRVVEKLVNGKLMSGRYQVVWNASDISSGIYFVRITVPQNSTSPNPSEGRYYMTRKMLVLK